MELIHTALFLASIFLLAAKIRNSKLHGREGRREAPGPWSLPLLGSLHCMLRSKLPHHTFRDLSAVHGPIMHLKLGEIRTVIISSAEAAGEIMKTHDIIFASRPINKANKAIFYGGNNIIFSPYGEFWRQMRRICSLELLSAKRVRSFQAVREEEVSSLILSIAASSGAVLNLSSKLAEIGNNLASRVIIGSRCDDQKLFFSAVAVTVEFNTGLALADLFPSLPFIGYMNGFYQRIEQCRKNLDLMAEKILQEHREKMVKHSAAGVGDGRLPEEDITDVLLRIQREGGLQFPLSDDNVKAVVNDLLLAGSETSTTIMEWAMSELIRNPTIMKRAQREVREALRNINEKLVDEELMRDKLTYLELVIKETLRLHPPAPLLLPRENRESCEVMGYEIPAKTTVIINMWAITRDPRYWENPDIFWPERFEENSLDFKGAHFEFAPFGAGRRICPGMLFGLATVEIALAYLLYYFDWEFSGNKMDMEEAFGVTTRRKTPLCAMPILHFPLPPSA